jgi:Flp pilus assembly protein TadG
MLATGGKPAIRKQSESGAVLVEFAFVLLPTMGFMFLLMALAWVIFAWACVQEGVREGARTAVTCSPSSGLNTAVQQTVQQYSFGFADANNVQVDYLDASTLKQKTGLIYSGDVVKVSISNLPVSTFAPIMGITSPLYVSASAADVMSCLTPASP